MSASAWSAGTGVAGTSAALGGAGAAPGSAGAGELAPCPSSFPEPFTPCSVGQTCRYPIGCCGHHVEFSCSAGRWYGDYTLLPPEGAKPCVTCPECAVFCEKPLPETCPSCGDDRPYSCVATSCYGAPQFLLCKNGAYTDEVDYCSK